MRTGISAAAFLAAGIVVAASAWAMPTQNSSPPPTNSGTEVADAGPIGLRGSHEALDDGRQASRVATGGPRRLSALSGSDDQAWASARSISPVPWRRAPRKPPQH
jgi:hypothetical protein